MTRIDMLEQTLSELDGAMNRIDRLIAAKRARLTERRRGTPDLKIDGHEAWLGTKKAFYWL